MDRLVGRAGGTRSPVDVEARLVVLVVLVVLVALVVGLDVGVVAVMVDVITVECAVIVIVYTRAPVLVSNFMCIHFPEWKFWERERHTSTSNALIPRNTTPSPQRHRALHVPRLTAPHCPRTALALRTTTHIARPSVRH